MSFSMNQAKDWYRWASQKKTNARARGEMGKSPRTIGRRGLVGNVGQPEAREIAQAVYDENLAASEAQQRYSETNARANGWTTMPPLRTRTRNTQNTYGNMNTAEMMSMSGVYGGRSRRVRKTRKARKSSRRSRTRAHRR
jgi:hypothetical protein